MGLVNGYVAYFSVQFFGCFQRIIKVLFPVVCNIISQWIIRVWCCYEGLNREKYSTNLQCRRPLIFEYIQAYTPQFCLYLDGIF